MEIKKFNEYKNNDSILDKVRTYALNILNELPKTLYYHNTEHTKHVVSSAIEIGNEENLTDTQMEIVQIAAWFHDTGYGDGGAGHEDRSKQIATDFLKDYPHLNSVLECIEATKVPQKPTSLEAKVLADADLYAFSEPDYHRYEQRLRKELEIALNKKYTDREWDEGNYKFMNSHNYHTNYGKNILTKFKEINRLRLKEAHNFE